MKPIEITDWFRLIFGDTPFESLVSPDENLLLLRSGLGRSRLGDELRSRLGGEFSSYSMVLRVL